MSDLATHSAIRRSATNKDRGGDRLARDCSGSGPESLTESLKKQQ